MDTFAEFVGNSVADHRVVRSGKLRIIGHPVCTEKTVERSYRKSGTELIERVSPDIFAGTCDQQRTGCGQCTEEVHIEILSVISVGITVEFFDEPPGEMFDTAVHLSLGVTAAGECRSAASGVVGDDPGETAVIRTRPKECPRVLLSHYPMIEEHPILRLRHGLIGQKNILKLMQEKKIDLSLCGHVHKPSRKVDADGRGEVCAGSVTIFGVMAEIDIDPVQQKICSCKISIE